MPSGSLTIEILKVVLGRFSAVADVPERLLRVWVFTFEDVFLNFEKVTFVER